MPEPRGPEGATCPTCRGTGADPMSDVTNWYPCQRCNGSGKVDPAPSSSPERGPLREPAGPGEAEETMVAEAALLALREAMAYTCQDRKCRCNAGVTCDHCLPRVVRAGLVPLLARLREAEETYTDEHGTVWSVPTAWAYMRACRALEEQHSATDTLRAEVARLGAENERLNKVAGENFAVAVEAQERIATARREEREAWWDLVDRAANALNDSICASGNRVSTNMHWVNKLRRDGEALRTREAAP